MPTPSEQKALGFFAIVLLLGGAARAVRAGPAAIGVPAEQQALIRQSRAVESAGKAASKPKKPKNAAKMSRSRRVSVVDTVAGVADVPFSDVRPGGGDRSGWVNGYPPPSPRIDRPARDVPGASPGRAGDDDRAGTAVDLDVATAPELEALPGVGPAMASRLVANRDSFGAFGSLDGLRRVRGMGPATIRRLARRVTFSSRPASLPPKRRDY